MRRRPLLAALALVLAVSVTACTSDDDPEPTAMPTTPSASSSPTPSIGADQDSINAAVEQAIAAKDTSALRAALREAGRADGELASTNPVDPREVDLRRNYRIAGWWLAEYEDDAEFSRLYDDGDLASYEQLSQSSSTLEDLNTLADHVQDDWQDQTGKTLNFLDTYGEAFDQELKSP